MDEIETFNKFLVAAQAVGGVTILRQPIGPMMPEDALNLAAWLVVVAGGDKKRFDAIYEAVCNT
jgi:hypothetical protein